MRFIEQEFPSMAPRFEKLYAKKYPPESYRKEVQGMVRALQNRYGVLKRERVARDSAVDQTTEAEQVRFAF
jgi:hypothetical protein